MDIVSLLQMIAIVAIPLILAVTLHEAAHGWVASKLGDQTARSLGRVTLNPIRHIDLVGTIIIPLVMLVLSNFSFMFGWAKPVPVRWGNLRQPKRDMALVALAGPGANLLMAFIWAGVAACASSIYAYDPTLAWLASLVGKVGLYGILINCLLMVLNLIPIPPLDGSRVVSALLPDHLAYQYAKIERYGILILIVGLYFLGSQILHPPVQALFRFITELFSLR
ncbi:site-2 protease family protein [Dongshaea marina]|uniref:site-2 protease family protein n=1 Tax=Dongshaea marina TaxID=2047966 RepID=UPI000D3EA9F3|nr:site-2 protease family protein [Dongshaea marina]